MPQWDGLNSNEITAAFRPLLIYFPPPHPIPSPPAPQETQNRELKSGMTKTEEFDSSIPLLAELLVIWADCGGGLQG